MELLISLSTSEVGYVYVAFEGCDTPSDVVELVKSTNIPVQIPVVQLRPDGKPEAAIFGSKTDLQKFMSLYDDGFTDFEDVYYPGNAINAKWLRSPKHKQFKYM